MSTTPEVNYAQQYEDTFKLLTQTQGAKFDGAVLSKEYTNASTVWYEQLGAVSEDDRDTRFGRTNYKDIKRFRRKLSTEDKIIALQIDKPDELRTLADVRNPYIQQTANAWKRSKDIFAVKGALGITYSGENGATANDFDWTNQIVPVATGAAGSTGLNVDKLIAAKELFWGNDVDIDNPMYELQLAITGKQISDLLKIEEFTSSDYNVRTLMKGEAVNFMGFNLIRSELLTYMNTAGTGTNLDWAENSTYGYKQATDTDSTDVRACFAWAKDMVCVATNKSYKCRAEELPEYNYNFGIFCEWGLGSMRHEEKGVVALPCDQSPA